MCYKAQIPLDGHEPDRTRPDQTLSATFPEKPAYYPDLFTDGRRHRNCCRFFNYTSMQLRGCEFITEEEKKTLCVGKKVHS